MADKPSIQEIIDTLHTANRAGRREYEFRDHLEQCLIGAREVFKTVSTAETDLKKVNQEIVECREVLKEDQGELKAERDKLAAVKKEVATYEGRLREAKLTIDKADRAQKVLDRIEAQRADLAKASQDLTAI